MTQPTYPPAYNKKELFLVLEEHRERTSNNLRLIVTYSLLALFVLNVLCVLGMIFFVGFGKMVLSEKLLFMLIGETMAQAVAIFLIIVRFLFPAKACG